MSLWRHVRVCTYTEVLHRNRRKIKLEKNIAWGLSFLLTLFCIVCIVSSILFSFSISPIEDKNPIMFKCTLQTPSVQIVPELDIIMNSLLQLLVLLFLPIEL